MPLFPKIDSPCPYRSSRATMFDGDFCRLCQRQVVDLDAFDDGERAAFLAGCAEEVCVSYRLPLRAAIAAAALATAVPAIAQDQPPATETAPAETESDAGMETGDPIMMVIGGIKDPAAAVMVEVPEDASVPDVPVVYDEAPDAPTAPSR